MTELRFKLDENVPIEAAGVLTASGYDCHTVYDERLAGAPDVDVAAACRAEERVLVTLDLDFSDVRAYPPGSHAGIVVLRPRAPDRDATLALLERVIALFRAEPLTGCLWIVDSERVRVRSPRAAG